MRNLTNMLNLLISMVFTEVSSKFNNTCLLNNFNSYLFLRECILYNNLLQSDSFPRMKIR